jgi:hypothetical protein
MEMIFEMIFCPDELARASQCGSAVNLIQYTKQEFCDG